MSEAPAGWYPQPDGTQRYWDGSEWTEHISGTPATPTTANVPVEEAVEETFEEEFAPEPTSAAVDMAAEPGPAAPIGAPAVMASDQYSGMSSDVYAAPETGKRKVWPIVLGVVLGIVAIMVVAIVAIAIIVSRSVSGPNEAVMDYDRAWQEVDCALMQETITEAFQERQGFDDCATFESVAQPFADAVDTYTVTVTSTEVTGDTAYVYTTEHWLDTDGSSTVDEYRYYLVTENGRWLVETVDELSAG